MKYSAAASASYISSGVADFYKPASSSSSDVYLASKKKPLLSLIFDPEFSDRSFFNLGAKYDSFSEFLRIFNLGELSSID